MFLVKKDIPSDLEIANSVKPVNIDIIGTLAGISMNDLEHYGEYKAKINAKPKEQKGKLILVTAINPTPAGEGKTTTSIGLLDGLCKRGYNAIAALREPSLGPVFGVKGGATGGGYAQVIPMEDINLHFTGDFHAIGAAANLLAAMVDNHIKQGNELGINEVIWKRAVDMNDRQLRHIVSGLGKKSDGIPRDDGFEITVASEVMAVLCLAEDIKDLKERLGKIIVGYSFDGTPITADDIKATGAMAVLLKDAIKPNLVQTLEHNPVIIHGGPFANIAHGCNSVIATKTALGLADYVVTEAGFGSDLGAEKFLDIKCRKAGLTPDCVVVVATVRALKYHGGVAKEDLKEENVEALRKGFANLYKHVYNIQTVFNVPCVVAVNKFSSDTFDEVNELFSLCVESDIPVKLNNSWENGSKGSLELADEVVRQCERTSNFTPAYSLDLPIEDKIQAIAHKIYGCKVQFTETAVKKIAQLEDSYSDLPICMAKTQYSFTDDPKKLGAPSDHMITIRALKVCAGAGFIVAYCGDIMTMPGLPKVPAANNIDLLEDGKVVGLF